MSEIVYPVNDLYLSIQGEGSMTGQPMFILRLHGCDVGCPWCDTKETWKLHARHYVDAFEDIFAKLPLWTQATSNEIVDQIEHLRDEKAARSTKWVLITGGEPALYDLRSLVAALHKAGFKVAIETSGTATGCVGVGFDFICVSPKINMPGAKPVLSEVLCEADEIKHVVTTNKDLTLLIEMIEDNTIKPECQICLQPESTKKSATALCVTECLWRGWRLSIQTHKYAGLK